MAIWKHLSSTYVHENPFYKVRRDEVIRPDGKEGFYHVIGSNNATLIIAITDESKILFVQMFRYTTQMDSWEIPAGGIEDGEEPLAAAQRELLEETGHEAADWQHIGALQASNGKMNAMHEVFVCRKLRQVGGDDQAEEGITKLTPFSMSQIMTMIAIHEITDNTTLAALMLALAQGKLPA
jgi:8-oxo-dGTP pyrophosphatase MutT (NUDIX family)